MPERKVGKRVWRRVGRLLAGNWIFVVIVSGGIALRLAAIVAYQPALLFSDAYAYLSRAITMSPTGSFHPFLYSILIKPFLVLGELAWIPIAQHLVGLGTGMLLYAFLRRMQLPPTLAALGSAPVLLDAYQINFEHQVLSEVFFQAFVVGALVVVAWNKQPTPAAAGVAGLLVGVSALIRFAGIAVIVAIVVFVLIHRVGWKPLGALAVGLLLPLVSYSLWFQSHSGSFGITNRNGFFLYGRVVSFADCKDVEVPGRLRVFCPRASEPKTQGLFASGLPADVRQDPNNNARALEFSKRMIAAKPHAYLSAVAADFLTYFDPGDPASRDAIDAKWRWPTNVEVMRIPRHVRENQEVPPPGSGIELRFEFDEDLAHLLVEYQRWVWIHGPLLAALLLIGLVGAAVGWKTDPATASRAVLFTTAVIGLLLFPPVFAVYHFRYVVPVIPLIGPVGTIGLRSLLITLDRRESAGVEKTASR